jgi:hypothetical protein
MRETIDWRHWAAIALSVCCCCLFTVACAGNSTTGIHKVAPPETFYWNTDASAGATTPQEAYSRSARFTSCRMDHDRMAPGADQSVTWLVSGPAVGCGLPARHLL